MAMWTNKVVLITGSSMGIGKQLAQMLGERGAKVVINARNTERLKSALTELQANGGDYLALPGDVSIIADCQQLIEQTVTHFGRLDVLINNAGLAAQGSVEATASDVYTRVTGVNYLGAVYCTQAALPHLRESRGSVLFCSTIAAIHGLPEYSIYSSTKMALTAFAESLKIELHGSGVHVGLAFIGFTQNDPQKTIYNASGKLDPIPARPGMKVMPVDQLAQRLLRIIEKRQHKVVLSGAGKALAVLNRLSPRLVETIFRVGFARRKE